MPGQTFNDLKKDFLQIIEGIQDQHELDALKMFVCQIVDQKSSCLTNNCCSSAQPSSSIHDEDFDPNEKLESILNRIKQLKPFEQPLSHIPNWSKSFEDCSLETTTIIDSFLYDDQEINELCEQGKITRSYCNDCGSKNTTPLNFISHSIAFHQLKWLFTHSPISSLIKSCTTILDVGSRIGSVLYGAWLWTPSKKIIGIEIDQEYVSLQREVIQKEQLTDRISIIDGDIVGEVGKKLLETENPDIIIFNNVFQFFVQDDTDNKGKGKSGSTKVKEIWEKLKETIVKPKTIIVSIPSLAEQFEEVGLQGLSDWVEEIPVDDSNVEWFGEEYGLDEDMVDDLRNVFLYRVL